MSIFRITKRNQIVYLRIGDGYRHASRQSSLATFQRGNLNICKLLADVMYNYRIVRESRFEHVSMTLLLF